jgi:hypothetical protein
MMGFTQPHLPDVDPDTFMQQRLMHRMKVLALHWVEHGFGTPRMVHTVYIVKLLVFYMLGGVVVAIATSRLPAFWHVAQWWNQPVVYEKAVLWTVLLETAGVAGSWGPLAGKFKPMTGGIRFWARTARSGSGPGSGCRSRRATGGPPWMSCSILPSSPA